MNSEELPDDLPVPICTLCIDRIKDYGFTCFNIMEQVCKDAINNETTTFKEYADYLTRIIHFLETNDFIITTEISKEICVIQINMQCCSYDGESQVFCWCENC